MVREMTEKQTNEGPSDMARMMRILDQVAAQGTSLPAVGRKQRRAAARSALKQARAEARARGEGGKRED
ncbi:hypothetical protein MAUB_57840 [Mycolicibacterium aubagnense]|uniref:Uncharacterized protein n=1 Tax=Mycolicibacterium aubagnense TaxID=319707 RepID=A0ABM7IM87_9MYCO|nr:hypothetical protein MAUB_57840 [Mycolicibacterium aubagnense]